MTYSSANPIPRWAKGLSIAIILVALGVGWALPSDHLRIKAVLILTSLVLLHIVSTRSIHSLRRAACFDLVWFGVIGLIAWNIDPTLFAWKHLPYALIGFWFWPGAALQRLKQRVRLVGSSYEKRIPPEVQPTQTFWIQTLQLLGKTLAMTLAISVGFAIPHWFHWPDWTLIIGFLPAFLLGYGWFDGPRPVWPYALPPVLFFLILMGLALNGFNWLALLFIVSFPFFEQLLFLLTGIPKIVSNDCFGETGRWRDKIPVRQKERSLS
jgi:hypothetical protein